MANWNKPREVKIEYEGDTFEFKLRPITYGEKLKMINEATVTKVINGKDDLTIDNMRFQMGLLRRSITEVKINGVDVGTGIKVIEDLPPVVGDELYEKAQKVSGLFREQPTDKTE